MPYTSAYCVLTLEPARELYILLRSHMSLSNCLPALPFSKTVQYPEHRIVAPLSRE